VRANFVKLHALKMDSLELGEQIDEAAVVFETVSPHQITVLWSFCKLWFVQTQ
jgi:hypothetical protein